MSHIFFIYSINQTSGALTLSRTNSAQQAPESIAIAGGSAAVTYVPKFAYAANRGDGTVSAYTVDPATGALTTVVGAGDGATGTNASGTIATGTQPVVVTVDPLGKFAYAANYAGGGVWSGYTINQSTGELTAMTPATFTTGSNPNSVTVDPSGKFAYIANYTPATVTAYTIDSATGAPTAVVGAGNGTTGTNASGTIAAGVSASSVVISGAIQ